MENVQRETNAECAERNTENTEREMVQEAVTAPVPLSTASSHFTQPCLPFVVYYSNPSLCSRYNPVNGKAPDQLTIIIPVVSFKPSLLHDYTVLSRVVAKRVVDLQFVDLQPVQSRPQKHLRAG